MSQKRDESFSRKFRLTKSSDFRKIISRGKRVSTQYFVIYSLPNRLSFPRLGIQVRAKLGTAVQRNYMKRIVRETFRKMKGDFLQSVDLVFIAQQPVMGLRYGQFSELFRNSLQRFLR
jgi:ribonuclease P protein component